MGTQYFCDNQRRLRVVRDKTTFNAIDYLEVLDADSPDASLRQRTLLVRCVRKVTEHAENNVTIPALTTDNVVIEGGVRRTPISVEWAYPAKAIPAALVSTSEQNFFNNLKPDDQVLVVRTDSSGDFSTYTLRLVTSPTDPQPPETFDRQLHTVEFSFKVECPSPFDCLVEEDCPPPTLQEPAIDYLSKDYASFRRLLLDRLSVVMPDWRERHPADQMVMLVEVLAYLGDHLSYFQDAVATEAYLGTARQRISVRRHARLLDYHMHDGSNARAWVAIEFQPASPANDGLLVPTGTMFLAGHAAPSGVLELGEVELQEAIGSGVQVFETLHPIELHSAHNELHLYTWGDAECCLPPGTTRATLHGDFPDLNEGDVLIFEEVFSPTTGVPDDADPTHRQAVRLTRIAASEDPIGGKFDDPPAQNDSVPVTEIEWAADDALNFPLCISAQVGAEQGGEFLENVSVARGNVALVDQGLSVQETLTVPVEGDFYPTLEGRPVTQQGWQRDYQNQFVLFDPQASARSAMIWPNGFCLPAVWLTENGDDDHPWLPQWDLLSSDRFAAEFVIEVDEEGYAHLRFGDDKHGKQPTAGDVLTVHYRVGSGRAGNVGSDTILHIVLPVQGIVSVRNPLPARGGSDPESVQEVRQYAPQAFRIQERAVTEADYAEVGQRRPDVQKAVASFRWTGSWHTAFVTVDRFGGDAAAPAFQDEMRGYFERYRMAGIDLDLRKPAFVPLEVEFKVCVRAGYFATDVERRMLAIFSHLYQGDGKRGFFHPDNFTFGQPIYLSQLYEAAMGVAGVEYVEVTKFQRWGQQANQEIDAGVLKVGKYEIIRLDNDRNFPENGILTLIMEGGL